MFKVLCMALFLVVLSGYCIETSNQAPFKKTIKIRIDEIRAYKDKDLSVLHPIRMNEELFAWAKEEINKELIKNGFEIVEIGEDYIIDIDAAAAGLPIKFRVYTKITVQ